MGYRRTKTYNYKICQNGMPFNNRGRIVQEIKRGTGVWKTSTQYFLTGIGIIKYQCTAANRNFNFLLGERANFLFFLNTADMAEYCKSDDLPLGCAKKPPKTRNILSYTNIAIEKNHAQHLECVAEDHDTEDNKRCKEDLKKGCTLLSRIVMHETGHVYGLHHPKVAEISVMHTIKDNFCQPTQLDVVAVKAIYQSR